MPLRVLLVDDHPLFRAGVIAALQPHPRILVVAEAAHAADAPRLVAEHRPDVAVIDLVLHDDDGLKLVRELRRDFPGLRIVVLSMLSPAVYRPRALQAGAAAFVSKQSGPEAVLEALLGEPGAAVPAPAASPLAELSERELEVFRHLGQGRSTQEIAATLSLSVKTVESHRENIKAKLDLPHANALVTRATLWVREQGLAR